MNTEIVKVDSTQPELPTELIELKNSTELKTNINADDILYRFAPFFKQISDVKKDIAKVNFENPTELDMSIADTIRKKLVKIRTASEREKTEMNKDYILVQKIVTGANNIVSSTCKLDENKLDEVAKFIQIQETKRLALILEERTKILVPFGFSEDDVKGLEKMSDEVWNSFLLGVKKNQEDKLAAEKLAEEQLLEALRIEAEEKEKQRLEMERLKAENEAKEKQLKEAQAKAEAEIAEQKRLADIEAKKQAEILAKQKAESEAILKKEQEAKAKLEAELKAKADAELKEKQRVEAEQKAKLEAEKKAAKAPDKDKMKIWINELELLTIDLKTKESNAIATEILTKFVGFKKWANEQIESI